MSPRTPDPLSLFREGLGMRLAVEVSVGVLPSTPLQSVFDPLGLK